MNLFAELKRRNVIRVAGLYLVVAWLVVQVAETLLPVFGTPEWVLKTLILLLAIGFIPTLIFSWVFEMTPEGLKRDSQVSPGESIAPHRARRLDLLILVGVVAIVTMMAADRFWPKAGKTSDTAIPVSQSTEARPIQATTAPVEQADADTRSIAVLPFVNMSPDPDNEYFADGISEELLNILAGVDGLKVASRTSAFSFKGKDTPIPEIARQLGVRHVLEGSVRKQGNHVRITAQLIEAGSDGHLWSQSYDRELTDIFAVQEEIAGAITVALKDMLGAREVKVDAPTRNMEAYQRYLHGRSRFYQRFELDQAIEDLRFAVERDPEFAEAWAFLAASYWLVGNSGYATRHVRSDMAKLAGPAVDRAMALKSDMPIAVALKGRLIIDSDAPGRVADGIRLMERAVALPGADTTPRLWLSLVWLELGYLDRALPLLESARRLDPLVGIYSGVLGVALAIEGRRVEADALVLKSVELDGLAVWGNVLATDSVYANDRAAAVKLVAAMLPLFSDRKASDRAQSKALLEVLQDPSREQSYLESATDELADTYRLPASLMFERGASAFRIVEVDKAKPWVIISAAWMPAMRWLREDPRYFHMMQRNGRVEYWDSYGYPRGCQPVDGAQGRHLSCPEQP
jgi:TolB-like protein